MFSGHILDDYKLYCFDKQSISDTIWQPAQPCSPGVATRHEVIITNYPARMEIIELFSSHWESGSLRGTPVMGAARSHHCNTWRDNNKNVSPSEISK